METYFGNLYDNTDNTVEPQSQEAEEEIMNRLMVTEEEVSVNIKNLKNRKAPGVDEILNELIKYGVKELARKSTELFNKIITTSIIPTEWLEKGQKSNPENYRGITLLCSTMKLLTNIVKRILERTIETKKTTENDLQRHTHKFY